MFYAVLMIDIVRLVLCNEAPQVILVNSMLLPHSHHESHDALAEYTYNDGDLVDVTCANPSAPTCYLKMDYIVNRNFLIPPWIQEKSRSPVGFQIPMGVEDDGTYASCTCTLKNGTASKVKVNFVRRKSVNDNHINVYINDAALRPTTNDKYHFNYLYNPNDNINITCQSEKPNEKALLKWTKGSRFYNDTQTSTQYLHSLAKNVNESFQCETSTHITTVTLQPKNLYDTDDGCWMHVELKESNASVIPSLVLYEAKSRTSIYEYKQNKTFNLTCIGDCNPSIGHIILPDGSGSKKAKSKIIDIQAIQKNNTFRCSLQEGPDDQGHISMVRILVFVRYEPSIRTTTPPTTPKTTKIESESSSDGGKRVLNTLNSDKNTTDDNNVRLLVAVGCVTAAVIAGVSTIIYKINKRKTNPPNQQLLPGDVNENLPNDGPIPSFPRQWESQIHYAEPVDRTVEPTYCEPCTGARANVKHELYTTPIPKARRKPAINQPTDPTYEELYTDRDTVVQNATDDPNYVDVTPDAFKNKLNLMYAQVQPKAERQNLNGRDYVNVTGDSPNYAQVVPKGLRGRGEEQGAGGTKYVNVCEGRYVNANDRAEYTEPAYCEPAILNKKK